jgi:hypothetical protein
MPGDAGWLGTVAARVSGERHPARHDTIVGEQLVLDVPACLSVHAHSRPCEHGRLNCWGSKRYELLPRLRRRYHLPCRTQRQAFTLTMSGWYPAPIVSVSARTAAPKRDKQGSRPVRLSACVTVAATRTHQSDGVDLSVSISPVCLASRSLLAYGSSLDASRLHSQHHVCAFIQQQCSDNTGCVATYISSSSLSGCHSHPHPIHRWTIRLGRGVPCAARA